MGEQYSLKGQSELLRQYMEQYHLVEHHELKQYHTMKKKYKILIAVLLVVILALSIFVYVNGSIMYDKGFNEGYFVGYDAGYDLGNEQGYEYGYVQGKKRGYTNGYDEGYDSGVFGQKNTIFVYVTPSGSKYHTEHCQYINDDDMKMPLNEAEDAGYTPCSKCHPRWTW